MTLSTYRRYTNNCIYLSRVPCDVISSSILLFKPQVSVTEGCRWWAWLAARGRHTFSCCDTCTCVQDNIPCRRLAKYMSIGASLLTTSPQQGCQALKSLYTGAGWVVVTGIRLIHIIAAAERHGGFLVVFYSRYTDSGRGGRGDSRQWHSDCVDAKQNSSISQREFCTVQNLTCKTCITLSDSQ